MAVIAAYTLVAPPDHPDSASSVIDEILPTGVIVMTHQLIVASLGPSSGGGGGGSSSAGYAI